ncbi:hypothetical protein AB1K91_17750 [Terribacillus sp. 179-K 1B1 HS]|uniref:hypothetical protein n=1 Tax=Terribacillus sp. 179-K 1B1 HS TaxID=3142388 RepID=UPI0039A3DF2F
MPRSPKHVKSSEIIEQQRYIFNGYVHGRNADVPAGTVVKLEEKTAVGGYVYIEGSGKPNRKRYWRLAHMYELAPIE